MKDHFENMTDDKVKFNFKIDVDIMRNFVKEVITDFGCFLSQRNNYIVTNYDIEEFLKERIKQ